jgi:hypothetical protein
MPRLRIGEEDGVLRLLSVSATLLLATVFVSWDASVSQAGTLNGTLLPGAAINQNLTAEGTIDWAIWGFADSGTSTSLTPDDHKTGGTGISALTNISNGTPLRGLGQFGDFAHTFDWTDGTPVLTASAAEGGLQHNSTNAQPNIIGEGFSLSVPADTQLRRLSLYVTAHEGIGTLTASLSDASAPDYAQDLGDNITQNLPGTYQIDYAADSAGKVLNVTYVLTQKGTTQFANVAIFAASLTIPKPLTTAPSVSRFGLFVLVLMLFAVGLLVLRRQEQVIDPQH